MKDISKLSVDLYFELSDKAIERMKEAHEKSCDEILRDIKHSAPIRSGAYYSSIQRGKTEETEKGYKTEIYSDMLVGGDDPKWANVPLACFVNWGTGPLGESTNIYQHGYGYTTSKPWNYIAQMQYEATGTWGMRANPHFYRGLYANYDKYIDNLKEAVYK